MTFQTFFTMFAIALLLLSLYGLFTGWGRRR